MRVSELACECKRRYTHTHTHTHTCTHTHTGGDDSASEHGPRGCFGREVRTCPVPVQGILLSLCLSLAHSLPFARSLTRSVSPSSSSLLIVKGRHGRSGWTRINLHTHYLSLSLSLSLARARSLSLALSLRSPGHNH